MNEDKMQPDTISVASLKAGSRSEMAKMVSQYSTPIYRLALKMTADPQDAEDVLQETFLKALRALPDFEGRSSLSTWLYRIAVNEALMVLRKNKGGPISLDANESMDSEEEDSEAVQVTDWCCLPEQELNSVEARKHLDAAVMNLPEKLRLVFLLRDIQGLSIKEAADALNLSESVVKTRLFRARLKLRDDLSVYFGERLAERRVE